MRIVNFSDARNSLRAAIDQVVEDADVTVISRRDAPESDPFVGIGKPEALKHSLSGCWSRRINETNRLAYQVRNDELIIISCRNHY